MLLAAAPGTGKSAVALTLALKARVPCFFFSADSDAFTVRTRAMAMINGITLDDISRAELSGDTRKWESPLKEIPTRFSFDPAPTYASMELSLEAYEEVYGEYPHLIVVDNITNVFLEDDEPQLEDLMEYLHSMGRLTGAHVLGLHHVTGEYNNGDKAIPLNGVKGQITGKPEMVLTLHRYKGLTDTLCVSTVKNRNGEADPSGLDHVELSFDGPTMNIT